MAELKTKKNDASVTAFLNTVEEENKRKDCDTVLKLMKQVSKEEPTMWGDSIIGFGTYHYQSERTSRGGEWFIMGLSPRKQNLTLYFMPGVNMYKELVAKLGKFKTGGSCLYINKLADVDMKILKELITAVYKKMNAAGNKKLKQ